MNFQTSTTTHDLTLRNKIVGVIRGSTLRKGVKKGVFLVRYAVVSRTSVGDGEGGCGAEIGEESIGGIKQVNRGVFESLIGLVNGEKRVLFHFQGLFAILEVN